MVVIPNALKVLVLVVHIYKMQYLLSIQQRINSLDTLGQVSEFLTAQAQELNYLTCTLLLKNYPLASAAIGKQSKQFQQSMHCDAETVWRQLPSNNVPAWVNLAGIVYLACAFNQGAAVLLIEPKQILTAEQKQATAMFWQLLSSPLSECVQRVLVGSESPFTQAEINCVTLTAACKTPEEISQALAISEHEVQGHLEHCLRKIGGGTISQLVSFCRQWGLLVTE
jgi:DNA-binding CsgD family transcriptional regulator